MKPSLWFIYFTNLPTTKSLKYKELAFKKSNKNNTRMKSLIGKWEEEGAAHG